MCPGCINYHMKLYPVFDTTYVTMYHALDIIVILSTNWGLKSNPPTGVKQIACCEFGVAVLNQEGQVYQQIHGNNGPRLKKNFVLLDAFISDDVTVKKIVAHPEGTKVSELCNSTELDLFFSFKIKTLSNLLFSSLSNYLISPFLLVLYNLSSGKHFLAITTQGELYSWGFGDGGVLGNKDNSYCKTPTRVNTLGPDKVRALLILPFITF